MPKRLNTYLGALAVVTLWGASFPLTKAALDYVGPISLAFLRWAIAAAALIGWLGWGLRHPAPPRCPGHDRSSEAPNERASGPARRRWWMGQRWVSRAPCAAHEARGNLVGRGAQAGHDSAAADAALAAQDGGGALIGRLLREDWRAVAWVALTGIALFYWLENTALHYTTAINAGVLSNLTSVFMVLIAIVMLGERLRAPEWVAIGAAFAGAVLVSQGAGHLVLGGAGLAGDLLMVAASLFAAIYSIGGKRLAEKYPAAIVTTVVATVGALFLLPLALIEGLRLDLPLSIWGILLLLGLGAGALANVWWLAILARMEASRAALALFLIPIVSAALAVALLDEPLTPTIVFGALLVLAGVAIVRRKVG